MRDLQHLTRKKQIEHVFASLRDVHAAAMRENASGENLCCHDLQIQGEGWGRGSRERDEDPGRGMKMQGLGEGGLKKKIVAARICIHTS